MTECMLICLFSIVWFVVLVEIPAASFHFFQARLVRADPGGEAQGHHCGLYSSGMVKAWVAHFITPLKRRYDEYQIEGYFWTDPNRLIIFNMRHQMIICPYNKQDTISGPIREHHRVEGENKVI